METSCACHTLSVIQRDGTQEGGKSDVGNAVIVREVQGTAVWEVCGITLDI